MSPFSLLSTGLNFSFTLTDDMGMDWGYYGRRSELERLSEILNRKRWFFAQITGRRRIGKTRLIQRALEDRKAPHTFYGLSLIFVTKSTEFKNF